MMWIVGLIAVANLVITVGIANFLVRSLTSSAVPATANAGEQGYADVSFENALYTIKRLVADKARDFQAAGIAVNITEPTGRQPNYADFPGQAPDLNLVKDE